MLMDAAAPDADITSIFDIWPLVAEFRKAEVAVRTIESIPTPPSTISMPTKPLIVSLPSPALMRSEPTPPAMLSDMELPKIVNPSLCALSVMLTPTVALDAEISSTLTICVSRAVLSPTDVAVRTIVSVPTPPSTVSAPTKPLMTSLPSPALMLSAPDPPVITSA